MAAAKHPLEKYIGALGLIGVLMVIFYSTGIVLNFKRIKRENLAAKHLQQQQG